jgi:nitroreductase
MTVMGTQRRDLPLLAPEATVVDILRWAVAHACLAPSELNTQPWIFRADVDHAAGRARVELALDRARTLPHLDPDRRGAVLACGGALLHLELALRAAGVGTVVRLCPDADHPDLLAVVEVDAAAGDAEATQDRPLREAIVQRGSRRAAFLPGVPPPELLDHLIAEGASEGALLTVLSPDGRGALHRSDVQASLREAADPSRAADRVAWTRSNVSDADDGVPGAALGLGLVASLAEPHRLRHGDSHVSHDDVEQEAHDPTVLVVGSAADDRAALMRAGAGLERVLLAATAAGLAARFANDSLRFPDLRRTVAQLAGLDHPQAVVHLGYGSPDLTVTPRRSVADVLLIA